MLRVSLQDVARLLGLQLPRANGGCKCPFREHRRKDKTFRVFMSKGGDELWKCWSCDPPDNVGDAISFYARYRGIDRQRSLDELRTAGIAREEHREVRLAERVPKRLFDAPPIQGLNGFQVLPMPVGRWRELRDRSYGDSVKSFLASRGLQPDEVRRYDVMDVGGALGFGYRDPVSSIPVRIKVRSVAKKRFWIEPRSPDPAGIKAGAPLYLAQTLQPGKSLGNAVVIVEGEIDALTIKACGVRNVVSLPDGAESAERVDLTPLLLFDVWVLALDTDGPGMRAVSVLRERAWAAGRAPVPAQFVQQIGCSVNVKVFKDANEAMVAGLPPHVMRRQLLDNAVRGIGGIAVELT